MDPKRLERLLREMLAGVHSQKEEREAARLLGVTPAELRRMAYTLRESLMLSVGTEMRPAKIIEKKLPGREMWAAPTADSSIRYWSSYFSSVNSGKTEAERRAEAVRAAGGVVRPAGVPPPLPLSTNAIDWFDELVATVHKDPFAGGIGAGVSTTQEEGIRKLWRAFTGMKMSDPEFAEVYLNLSGGGQVRILTGEELLAFGVGIDQSKYGAYINSWRNDLVGGRIPEGMPPEMLAKYLLPQQQRDFITFYKNGNLTDTKDFLSLKKDFEDAIYGYATQFDFNVEDLLRGNTLFNAVVNAYEEATAKTAASWRLGVFLPPMTFRAFLKEGILIDTILQSERGLKAATWQTQQKAQIAMAKIEEAKSEAEAEAANKLGAVARAKMEADAFQAEKVGDTETATSIRRILAARQYLLSFLPADQAFNVAQDFGRLSPFETFTQYATRVKGLTDTIKGLAVKIGGVPADTVVPDLVSYGAIDPMINAPFMVGSTKAPNIPGQAEPFPMITPEVVDRLNKEAAAIRGKQLAWQSEGPPTDEFDIAARKFISTLPITEQVSAYKTLTQQGLPIMQLQFEQEWGQRTKRQEAPPSKEAQIRTVLDEFRIWSEENVGAAPETKQAVETLFKQKQAGIEKTPTEPLVLPQEQGFRALSTAWTEKIRGMDLSILYSQLVPKKPEEVQKAAQQIAQPQVPLIQPEKPRGRTWFPTIRL